jgi:hypothetical protein
MGALEVHQAMPCQGGGAVGSGEGVAFAMTAAAQEKMPFPVSLIRKIYREQLLTLTTQSPSGVFQKRWA